MTYNELLDEIEKGGIYTIGHRSKFDHIVKRFVLHLNSKFDITEDITSDDKLIVIPDFHLLGSGHVKMKSIFRSLRGKNAVIFTHTYRSYNNPDQIATGNEIVYLSNYVGFIRSHLENDHLKYYIETKKLIFGEKEDIDISHLDTIEFRERRLKKILIEKERDEWI